VRLSDSGLTLADIDLGGFDAESDRRLADYFVTTSYVADLIAGRGTLYLGRKGSGKSALFGQLPRLLPGDLPIELVRLTPDQYAWAALSQYTEQGLIPEHAHSNAWKLTIVVEVAAAIASLERSWSPESSAFVDELRRFLSDNFGRIEASPTTRAVSIIKSLRHLNLSALGIEFGFDRKVDDKPPLTPDITNRLLEALVTPLREVGVLVALDKLDESWDGSETSKSMMVGLLKAAKELNDRIGLAGGVGLRVVTFLRTDIYDGLEFDDKDKHRPTERQLLWSYDELREMLRRRLPPNIGVDELFEPGEMRGSIAPFNYIIKRTFLRPREVLQFVDACLNAADKAQDVILKDNIRTAETVYSGWKVDDLKQEFRKVFPSFDRLIECLRQETHRYDSLEELIDLLQRKQENLVNEYGARTLLEVLFEASVIGVRLGGSGSPRFKSEDPYLTLPASGGVYVHQALHDGLNIREARRTHDDDVEMDLS
jgi:hypothetical protein